MRGTGAGALTIYLVGYDLHSGEDYTALKEAIVDLADGHWHCLDSTWLISHAGPASAIREALTPHMIRPDDQKTSSKRAGDKLLVATVTRDAAWTRSFPDDCQEWLRSNL